MNMHFQWKLFSIPFCRLRWNVSLWNWKLYSQIKKNSRPSFRNVSRTIFLDTFPAKTIRENLQHYRPTYRLLPSAGEVPSMPQSFSTPPYRSCSCLAASAPLNSMSSFSSSIDTRNLSSDHIADDLRRLVLCVVDMLAEFFLYGLYMPIQGGPKK